VADWGWFYVPFSAPIQNLLLKNIYSKRDKKNDYATMDSIKTGRKSRDPIAPKFSILLDVEH